MTLTPPLSLRLADANAEAVRRNVDQRIGELQRLPTAFLIVVGDFVVPNGGSVLVPHRLGRKPLLVVLSPPRSEKGAPGLVAGGILIDLTGSDVDRTQAIRIFAAGYGVDVTVTVAVF
jgi:hypothetical protein